MKTLLRSLGKKLVAGAVLSASVALAVAPAQAQDYYRRDNDAAVAIGAGVIGLALGAALADRDDRYYYDRGRWDNRRYVTVRDRPGYYYYYAGNPNRYYRDRYYSRYYQPWTRDRWRGDRYDRRDRWDRGRDWRAERRWDRGDGRWNRHDRRWDRRDGRWDRRDGRWRDREDRRR